MLGSAGFNAGEPPFEAQVKVFRAYGLGLRV